MKVKATQGQLTLMEDIVSKMKKDKEKATKQVKEMEAALQGLITKIRVRSKMFPAGCAGLVSAVGGVSCLASGFSGSAHSSTSCQLLVKVNLFG